VIWKDYEDALYEYKDNPDAQDILDTTLSSAPSQTYDDKPKFSHVGRQEAQAGSDLPNLDQARR
jgi:hypothetical protein